MFMSRNENKLCARKNVNDRMDNLHNRMNLDVVSSFTTAKKSVIKLVNLQRLVARKDTKGLFYIFVCTPVTYFCARNLNV